MPDSVPTGVSAREESWVPTSLTAPAGTVQEEQAATDWSARDVPSAAPPEPPREAATWAPTAEAETTATAPLPETGFARRPWLRAHAAKVVIVGLIGAGALYASGVLEDDSSSPQRAATQATLPPAETADVLAEGDFETERRAAERQHDEELREAELAERRAERRARAEQSRRAARRRLAARTRRPAPSPAAGPSAPTRTTPATPVTRRPTPQRPVNQSPQQTVAPPPPPPSDDGDPAGRQPPG